MCTPAIKNKLLTKSINFNVSREEQNCGYLWAKSKGAAVCMDEVRNAYKMLDKNSLGINRLVKIGIDGR
jgi:hypothetical protein